MKLDELPTRKDLLYGPKRINANPAIKNLLTKDNIKHEAKDGTTTSTTCFSSFGKKTVKLDRVTAKLSTETQRTSNFAFGACSPCFYTTTTSEFCKHDLPTVEPREINSSHGTTSIPDFNPSCLKGKKIGNEGSVYASSYQLATRKYLKSATMKKSNSKKQTEDMQSTHFNLGTDKDRASTETGHSYHSRKPANTHDAAPANLIATSCVFRKGDWNITGSGSTTTSVSHDDFNGDKNVNLTSLPRLVNPAVPKPFNLSLLGSDPSATSSLYQNDFLKYDMTECHLKPIQEGCPKSSKILVQTPGMTCPKSTEQSDFVYRYNEAKGFLKKQHEEFSRNQRRQKKSYVVIADNDENKNKGEKVSLLTSKDYGRPSDEILRCHKLHRRPSPLYDYIRLEKGLVDHPEKCLVKRTRKFSRKSQSLPRVEGAERFTNNYDTHFSFGLNNFNNVQSEQHDRFTLKVPVDPSYPAAGSTKHHIELNTHVYARDDISRSDSIGQPSVMQADYNPILKRRFSSAQRRLLANNLKYPPKIASSHYFHLDHVQKPKKSTTTCDYAPPEVLLGDPGITVQ